MTSGHSASGSTALRRGPAVNRTPLVALVLSVVALAIGGTVISVGLIQRGAPQPKVPALKGPFGVGQDIPTSFGVVAVEAVQKLNGLSPKKLAGMTHFPSYVKPNQTQVQASVTLTNLLDRPVAYSPTQFRLLVGERKEPVKDLRASFTPGTLQPDANISGQLKFVAPRKREKLWVQFTDPKRSKPILVDLGKTGRTPANAFDGFHAGH